MKKIFALILAAAGAVSPVLAQNQAAMADSYNLDYSATGSNYITLQSDALLGENLGLSLYLGESEYLVSNFGGIRYNIPSSKYVTAEKDGSGSTYAVSAGNYEYTAMNGQSVLWVPKTADGVALSDGAARVEDGGGDYISVGYEAKLSLPQDYVNEAMSAYPSIVLQNHLMLEQKAAEYSAAYDKYRDDVAKYNAYTEECQKYEQDFAEYQKYVTEFTIWKSRKELYDKYLADLAEYEKQSAAYKKYLELDEQYRQKLPRYQQYLQDLADYEKALAEYNDALSDPRIELYKHHIDIVNFLQTPVYLNDSPRTLYSAIMGDSVSTVLSNLGQIDKNTLSMAHVQKDAIDRAADATRSLRGLLPGLLDRKTDEDKYVFYEKLYEVRENLVTLLQTLNYLYKNNIVYGQIQNQGKVPQFKILLAQLYFICNALYDGAKLYGNVIPSYYKQYRSYDKYETDQFYNFDSSYRIDGQTPAQILGGVTLADLNAAAPLTDFNINLPQKPTPPETVEEPEKPDPVKLPVQPDAVDDPGDAPTPVAEPKELTPVAEPKEPKPYTPTEREGQLEQAYKKSDGMYTRESYRAPVEITITAEVKKYIRNFIETTVTFFLNKEDDKPVWEQTVTSGEYAEYVGQEPEMTKRGYTCEFIGWQTDVGEPVDLHDLPRTDYLKLYPRFKETPNMYTVFWDVEGVKTPCEVPYGSTPNPDDVFRTKPTKQDGADGRKYRFSGWDREIAPMSDEEVTYYAQFEESCLVTFIIEKDRYVYPFFKGDMPSCDVLPQKPDDSQKTYTFSGWDPVLTEARGDCTYRAQFSGEYIMPLGGSGATVTFDGAYCVADCRKHASAEYDISSILAYAAGKNLGLKLRLSAAHVTFTADRTADLVGSGTSRFVLRTAQTGATSKGYASYRFSSEFTGDDPSVPTYGGAFSIGFSANVDARYSVMMCNDGSGELREVPYTYSDFNLEFTMTAGYVYDIYPVYRVSCSGSDEVSLSADAQTALGGQKITLAVGEPPMGRRIQKVFYTDDEGNETIVEGNSFKMPDSPVVVGVVCVYIEYTVTFIADGETISVKTYHYGDEVQAPANPVKSPDDEYFYTFAGWDKELTKVTEDKTYTALFTSAPIPVVEAPPLTGKTAVLVWILNNIIWLAVVAAVLIIGATVTVILLIRRRIKNKKRQ